MAGQNKVFALSESAYQQGSDYDIVMLYQVLLGRNPENSAVIQDHRANGFNKALETFVSSQEFRDSVLDPVRRGAPVRRHDQLPRPSADQLNWLFSRAILDEGQKTILRQSANWEQFFQFLCSLDGFLEPAAAPPPPPPEVASRPMQRPKPLPSPPKHVVLPQPGPSNADVMIKLERLEAMLVDLLARVGVAAPQPSLPDPVAVRDRSMDKRAARPAVVETGPAPAPPNVKPSSKRQAR
jgi:hypothetical protein